MATPAGLKFLKRFKEKYPEPQSPLEVVLRYDSVYLLADAVKAVGLDTRGIRDYLYQMPERQGVEYRFRFDKNGDVIGVPYGAKKIAAGKIAVIP